MYPRAIYHHLNKAFVETLESQREKIAASGMDLGSRTLFRTRLGFSGTPNDLLPQAMGRCMPEPGSAAKTVLILTDPSLTAIEPVKASDSDGSSRWSVEGMLTQVATAVPGCMAMVDTGALVTGLSNEDVARFFMEDEIRVVGLRGCVFIDVEDRQRCVLRSGACVPIEQCGLKPDERFTFYDQQHSTGMDIKQGVAAVCCVTLGKGNTLRDLQQGAWRMRGIGQGQTIKLVLVPEIRSQIIDYRLLIGNRGEADASTAKQPTEIEPTLHDIIAWLLASSMANETSASVTLCEQEVLSIARERALDSLLYHRRNGLGE